MYKEKKLTNGLIVLLILTLSLISMFFNSNAIKWRRENKFIFFDLFSYLVNSLSNAYSNLESYNKIFKANFDSKKEIEDYKNKIQSLEILFENIASLRRENYLLREQLNFYGYNKKDYIPSQVIYLDYSDSNSIMNINKGFSSGVQNGMVVIAYQDGFSGLVGQVIKTYSSNSLVLLIDDLNSFIAARIQSNRFSGLVRGMGRDKNLKMEYINKLAFNDLKVGDMIISEGVDFFPKGLYIGKVVSFNIIEYNGLLEIDIEQSIIFDKLEYVFVVKNEKVSSSEEE